MKSIVKLVTPKVEEQANGQLTFAPTTRKRKTVQVEMQDVGVLERFTNCCDVCKCRVNIPHNRTGEYVKCKEVFNDGDPKNRLRTNITLLCHVCRAAIKKK